MTSSGVSALFNKGYINGVNVDSDFNMIDYLYGYSKRPVIKNNTGIHQYKMGIHVPTLKIGGYRNALSNSQQTAWETLRTLNNTPTTADPQYFVSWELGNGASPGVGDGVIVYPGREASPIGSGTDTKPDDLLNFGPSFDSNGKRTGMGHIVAIVSQAGDSLSAAFDSNPLAYTLPTKGAFCGVQIITPTGTAASGTVTGSGTISDADTVTINGTVYTFKTSLTPTAGQVLIGASNITAMQNLYAAMIGGYGSGTLYAAGTTTVVLTTVNVTPPGTTGIITITYRTTGTGGNAYTLAKSGTNLAVSGATLAGGVAGETAAMTFKSATASGGSYSTFGTLLSDGTTQTGEWLEIATGTTINRYIKVNVDMSASSQSMTAHFYFVRYWIN